MGDELLRAWKDARERELASWPLNELVMRRDSLGLKMDPKQSYNMAEAVADEEMRQIREGSDLPQVPGAILEAIEADPPAKYTYKDWDIANPEDIEMTTLKDNNPYHISTSSGWFIYEVILPEVMRKFFSKNADYGDQHRTGLGIKAEFVGLHRKFAKLKAFFWDNQEMNHETGEEMLQDVIGACLLMLDLMNWEEAKRRAVVEDDDMPDPAAY
jgi:hypothetical protein